jgi:hypothetical protein
MKRRPRLTTVPRSRPAKRALTPRPKGTTRPPTPQPRRASARVRAEVARIVDDSEKSLVDVIDNLLNQGVMLNADIVLALADVDLVYLRLSTLLCAADRILSPPGARARGGRRRRA